MHAAVAHRRALKGGARDGVRREAERADVAGKVVQPQRRVAVAQMLEQLQPVGPPVHDLLLLVVGEPGDDEVQR